MVKHNLKESCCEKRYAIISNFKQGYDVTNRTDWFSQIKRHDNALEAMFVLDGKFYTC